MGVTFPREKRPNNNTIISLFFSLLFSGQYNVCARKRDSCLWSETECSSNTVESFPPVLDVENIT